MNRRGFVAGMAAAGAVGLLPCGVGAQAAAQTLPAAPARWLKARVVYAGLGLVVHPLVGDFTIAFDESWRPAGGENSP